MWGNRENLGKSWKIVKIWGNRRKSGKISENRENLGKWKIWKIMKILGNHGKTFMENLEKNHGEFSGF